MNAQPRPLCVYYFDHNSSRTEKVLSTPYRRRHGERLLLPCRPAVPSVSAGGPERMGHYHGFDGFANVLEKRRGVSAIALDGAQSAAAAVRRDCAADVAIYCRIVRPMRRDESRRCKASACATSSCSRLRDLFCDAGAVRIASVARINADPRDGTLPALLTREESDAGVDRVQAHFDRHGFGLFAAELREDGSSLGSSASPYRGLKRRSRRVSKSAAASADHWGRGLATEGAREALRYGFETCACRRSSRSRCLTMYDHAA